MSFLTPRGSMTRSTFYDEEHTVLDNESDRKQLRDDAVAMASHTQEALAARVLAVKSLLHLQVRLRAESRDGEADWVAFYRCECGHGADPFVSKKLIFTRWLHPAVRSSVPRCEARLVTPSACKITLRLASQRLACSWRRFRSSANSATVRSATCNNFSSQDHVEAGCAKTGTAQFSHGQDWRPRDACLRVPRRKHHHCWRQAFLFRGSVAPAKSHLPV